MASNKFHLGRFACSCGTFFWSNYLMKQHCKKQKTCKEVVNQPEEN